MDTTTFTALFSIILGTIPSCYKLFIPSPKDLRSQIKLKKKELLERHAIKHTELLQHLRLIIDTDDELRGDGRESIDLVGDYSDNTLKLFMIIFQLELLQKVINIARTWILFTLIVGVINILLNSLIPTFSNSSIYISITTIIIQILLIVIIFYGVRKLESYEDIT